jgi:DNA polymerase
MANAKTKTSAAEFLPDRKTLTTLASAAKECRGCDLWELGTQAVFGEGAKQAEVILVGEQPGDREDIEGRPFVGPAGKLLDRALEEAGIDRTKVYVTNVVKHFKFEERGKRRIHKKPNLTEIRACRPWLDAELEQIQPKAIVALGSTAAQALLGKDFKVTKQRGELVDSDLAPLVTATVHPSSILRAPSDDDREKAMREFVADLTNVAHELPESALIVP